MINIFLTLNILMSISIHIPFYNPNPQKKEGYRQLTRFEFLKENIENLKSLSIKSDIFIHTHNNFLDDKNLDAQIINHSISEADVNKGLLTWLSRPLMEKQIDDYDYFMYLEHDIKFSEENLKYLLKYEDSLNKKKFHLGFLVYERNHNDQKKYCIHLTKKLHKFIKINSQKFFINDLENYCCFWVYNKKIFKNFIKTKWWSFEKKPTNFKHNYGITERSSIGYHAFSMNYFKATLLPEINGKPDPDCFVEHMTNNYFEKFSDTDKKNYYDIRGVCKYDIENLYEDDQNQEEKSDFFYLIGFVKLIFWKLRFFKRIIKK
jgi:hypothetical protein